MVALEAAELHARVRSPARQLGNERGGLPFSVAIDTGGRVAERKLGETHYDELAGWARTMA